jgi:hypothetical protein
MKKLVSIREFLSSPKYAGTPDLMGGASWSAWRTLLIAAMGEPLTADELLVFQELTGRAASPSEPVKKLLAVIWAGGQANRALWQP